MVVLIKKGKEKRRVRSRHAWVGWVSRVMWELFTLDFHSHRFRIMIVLFVIQVELFIFFINVIKWVKVAN